jgi:hypothetical protein
MGRQGRAASANDPVRIATVKMGQGSAGPGQKLIVEQVQRDHYATEALG